MGWLEFEIGSLLFFWAIFPIHVFQVFLCAEKNVLWEPELSGSGRRYLEGSVLPILRMIDREGGGKFNHSWGLSLHEFMSSGKGMCSFSGIVLEKDRAFREVKTVVHWSTQIIFPSALCAHQYSFSVVGLTWCLTIGRTTHLLRNYTYANHRSHPILYQSGWIRLYCCNNHHQTTEDCLSLMLSLLWVEVSFQDHCFPSSALPAALFYGTCISRCAPIIA